MTSPFGKEKDIHYMHYALAQARKAFEADEVPVGAIVVDSQGTILARAHNQVEAKDTQAAHAEIQAISRAGKKMGDWRLEDCWVYVTLEPCALCMNMIQMSRCAGVVYGADSPLFGYRVVDKDGPSWLYKKDTLHIVAGVEAEESVQLLKRFFKQKREYVHG